MPPTVPLFRMVEVSCVPGVGGDTLSRLKKSSTVVMFENEPQALPLQPAPESDQVTPWCWKSFTKAAVKDCVPLPAGTLVVAGETLTERGWLAPAADLNAAKLAPQVPAAARDALADATPA